MPASDVTISVESQTLTRITDYAISSTVITDYTGTDTEVVVPSSYYPYQQETGNTLRFETQNDFLTTGMADYGFMYLMLAGHFSYKTNDSNAFEDVEDGMAWVETAASYTADKFPLEIILPTEYTVTEDNLTGGDADLMQVLSPFVSMHISNNFILSFSMHISNNFILSFTYQIGDSSPIDVDMDIASEMVVNSIDNSLFNLRSMLPIKISNIKYGKTIACVGEGANIKALAFHAEITESDDVFVDNSTVTKITIDEGVTSLGYGSIRNCANLQELVLPSTLERIFNSSVFDNCPNLEYNEYNNGKYLGNSTNSYVLLMDVVDTSVSDFAVNSGCKIINTNFAGCSNLSNVTIPASVSFIYTKPNSKNIHYQGTLNQWLDISFKNSSSSGDNLYINNNQLVEEITISKNVKDFAFHGIDSLTKVTIVEGVTAISSGAFSSCSNLSEIVLPSTLTLIADGTFQECTSLKTVTIASEEIYSIVTGIGLDNAGGLLANATTVKVLKTIDDGSNTYLSSTDEFTLDNTSDPTYNIYTK